MKYHKNNLLHILLNYRNININDLEVIRFFSYTSQVDPNIENISFYRDDSKHFSNINNKLIQIYDAIVNKATINYKAHTGIDMHYHFNGNKSVFLVRNIKTNNMFFIGRYDWNFRIGKACYMNEGRFTDFTSYTQSEYMMDIYANFSGVFSKLSI